jgi:hypothetical protein
MLEALKRLLSPEYLVVADPGPMGRLWLLYLALGLLFAAGLAWALWLLFGPDRPRCSNAGRIGSWFELWVCLAGLITVAGRFLGWPGWSARIWPYTLAALAIVGALVYRFRHCRLPTWLSVQLRILIFSPPTRDTEPSQRSFLLALLLHLLGITLVLATRYGWPLWAAPLVLVALLTPQVPLLRRRRLPNLMALSPLLAAYAVTILWLLYLALDITVIGWQGLAFPDPMVSLFYVDGVVLAAATYSVVCQFAITSSALDKPGLLWRWTIAGLLVATLAWAGIVYFGKRTHGATASDPYAYAQMGVDLAERGTFLHRYALFQEVIPLDIAWAPLQPVGYHIPLNDLGDCPSVWATGASLLLAAGYLLFGETGLYVTTPIVALLALAATWALTQEVFRGESGALRYLVGALAVAFLATSPEHVDRLLVPMADAAAQLFTVLTLLFALRGMRQLAAGQQGRMPASAWSFLLAGIFLAWAYWVRHTQLVLVLPVILAILLGNHARSQKANDSPRLARVKGDSAFFHRASYILLPLATFSIAALLAALPDIIYRWRVFGGPFATETTELPLMGFEHIGPVAWQMLRDTLVAGEWGYLFPLALYGTYRLACKRKRVVLVLSSGFLAVLLVNLTYHSLRLRDLISLFPFLDLAVAYGGVALVRRVRTISRHRMAWLGPGLLSVVTITWVILSLALSRWAMIDNLWKPGWASFGYMRAEHRAAFDRLAQLTPPNGVVGASLNAGAVMLYTGRDAIRPYDSWTVDEWQIFLDAMRAAGRPVYLLDDGGLMARFIEAARDSHRLTPIEELALPLFYTRDRETGWLYRLEWEP